MKTSNSLTNLWFAYNSTHNEITQALGRTSNIVCEFSELLVAQNYGGSLLPASYSSADVLLPDGRLLQVKARIPRQGDVTSLGIIRSWDFDMLVVVMFCIDGTISRAVELDASDAKRLSVHNEHQNGWVITTTCEFYDDPAVKDITECLKQTMLALDPEKVHAAYPDDSPHSSIETPLNNPNRSSTKRNKSSASPLASRFRNYLLSTSSPRTGMKYSSNTVNSYISGINTVCKEENCIWEDLAPQIDSLVFRYDIGGDKYEIGEKGKKTVINALRAYQRFIAAF